MLVSCILTYPAAAGEKPYGITEETETVTTPVNDKIELTADNLLIAEDFGDSRIVEIYKDEILDNSERKFLDLLNYYQNGELLAAKLQFDNLLETLEYLYGDNKVSDRVMLENFWDEFSNQSVKRSANIFEIYNSLFSDENLFEKETGPVELVIEQDAQPVEIKQNNDAYIYIEGKTRDLFGRFGSKPSDEFIKTVYDYYINNLSDRVGIRETFIRSQKYTNFIRVKLKENGLDEIFTYLPAAKTAFYEGSRNGSIWRLENTKDYRNIRNNIGASTAEVIRRIKALKSGSNEMFIIASILEEGKYGISRSDLVKDVYTDDLAGFISFAVILGNPSDHDLKTADIENSDEKSYFSSYEDYVKDPRKFAKAKSSSKSTTRTSTQKSRTSFIRINYKVKRGDNLDKIANLFGVTVAQLKQWNPKDTSKKYLYPGMTLYVRGDNFQYYTARSGDSIGKIASRYKMTVSEFKQINELRSNTIYKGRKYIVKK
jgi:LysM repeat protein